MMHGHEKSDPEIVAMKPANNAAPTAAEWVERRAGIKGNAGQQSTLRAQDRAGVSQALDRIRQAARQQERTVHRASSSHHVSDQLLRDWIANSAHLRPSSQTQTA
jgi:RNA-directed DNA polymerase